MYYKFKNGAFQKFIYFFKLGLFLFTIACSSAIAQKSRIIDFDSVAIKTINQFTVFIDGAHQNYHTKDGRYLPLSKFLESNSYSVKEFSVPFYKLLPELSDVLIIANALHPKNVGNWTVPVWEAFTNEEIRLVEEWVRKGGSLLLIADHMPFPGAADKLASKFGFTFYNGFAFDTTDGLNANFIFTKSNNYLKDHPITNGKKYGMRIDTVATFLGQGFEIPDEAISLLTLPTSVVSLMPDTAWVFDKFTPRQSLKGCSQGAVMNYGKGKIAVFGEAAMFTHQEIELASDRNIIVGFNAPHASQNKFFIMNLLNWLSDK